MPASQTTPEWRGRWLPIMFWAGVGLAPLAAVLLLLGQGSGPLRVAAVLAIVSVVLIGLSVTLRNDVDAVRQEFEETVYDETDAIREDVREDLVTAARKIHGIMQAEIAALADELEDVRSQLAHSRAIGAAPVSGPPVPRAPVSGSPVGGSAPIGASAPVGASAPLGAHAPLGAARGGASGNGARATARAAAPVGGSGGSYPRDDLDEPTGSRRRPVADRWSSPPPSRPALEATPRRWDPLNDDLTDQPAADRGARDPLAERTAGWQSPPAPRAGRRRAAEPDDYDEPTRLSSVDSGRREDPWADLRGHTQPAEVRFGGRGYDGAGGHLAEVRALRPETHHGGSAQGWQRGAPRSASGRAAGRW